MELTTHTFTRTGGAVDKVARYGWVTKTGPGKQALLHKSVLQSDDSYQRGLKAGKVSEITAAWSWAAFGALMVSHRDGKYWLMDGHHRQAAALRRSDIDLLPCVVFDGLTRKDEARAFHEMNTGRRPVTAVDKHRALTVADDPVAVFVADEIAKHNLTITPSLQRPGQIKCLGWCMKRATDSKEKFSRVLALAADMSARDKIAMQEHLLEGLWHLHAKCGAGLDDARLRNRLIAKGARVLCDAARRATAYYGMGGGKVWANGMLAEINKGLKSRFSMDGELEAE